MLENEIKLISEKHKINYDIPIEKLSGYSFHLLIKIYPLNTQKQYIYDTGSSIDSNRISLYLDKKNYLTFRIIDNDKETYTIKGEFKKPEIFHYICYEIGKTDRSSFLNLYIDEILVASQKLDLVIDIRNTILLNSRINADLNNENNAKIDLPNIYIFGATLSEDEKSKMRDYVMSQQITAWIEYPPTSWHRWDPTNNAFIQPIKKFQPIFRKPPLPTSEQIRMR